VKKIFIIFALVVLLTLIAIQVFAYDREQIVAADGRTYDLYGNSVSTDGTTLVVGAPLAMRRYRNFGGWVEDENQRGYVYFYQWNGQSWVYENMRRGSNDERYGWGSDVAVDGDWTIVSESGFQPNGAVHFLRHEEDTWARRYSFYGGYNFEANAEDLSSGGVDIDGRYAVTGANRESFGAQQSGAAYVYVYEGPWWDSQAHIRANDYAELDYFAYDVAISGQYIIAGSINDDYDDYVNLGSAYIFKNVNEQWSQSFKIEVPEEYRRNSLGFGRVVEIDGDLAAVTSHNRVYLFEKSGEEWGFVDVITSPVELENNGFAESVSIADGTILIGSTADRIYGNNYSGAMYVYYYDGNNIILQSRLIPDNPQSHAYLGKSVCTDGTHFVGGAYRLDTEISEYAGGVFDFTNVDANQEINIHPVSRHFDAVNVGNVVNYSHIISNMGMSDLTITNVTSDVEHLTPLFDNEVVIEPLQSYTLQIAMEGIMGSINGTITIESNDDDENPAEITYTGGGGGVLHTLISDELLENGKFGMACDGFGDYMIMSGEPRSFLGYRAFTEIYKFSQGEWVIEAGFNGSENSWFGADVAIGNNWALIGAPENNGGTGSAYVYNRRGGDWSLNTVLRDPDGIDRYQFGARVGLSEEWMAVASIQETVEGVSYAGTVMMYRLVNGEWQQVQKIQGSQIQSSGNFGSGGISIYGNEMVIGSPKEDNKQGAAYIFQFDGEHWVEVDRIVSSQRVNGEEFGYSVHLNNDQMIIGEWYDAHISGGSAHIYSKVNDGWEEQQILSKVNGQWSDRFGQSVGIYDNYVAVGCYESPEQGRGSVYIYTLVDGNWELLLRYLPEVRNTSQDFGHSLALTHKHLIIGAPNDNSTGAYYGAGYVWNYSAGEAVPIIEVDRDFDFSYCLTNPGTTLPLTIQNEGISDLVISDISIDNEVFTCEFDGEVIVAAGDFTVINVTFRPAEYIEYTADLIITSNDEYESNLDVDLVGIGAAELIPVLTTGPEALDFGSVMNFTTEELTLQLINEGNTPLNISNIFTTGEGYNVSFQEEFAVGIHDPVDLSVYFTPQTAGEIPGTVVILSDDPENGEFTVNLTGIGLDPPTISVDPMSIETNESGDHVLTVNNSGDIDLNWSTSIENLINRDAVDRRIRRIDDRGPQRDFLGQALHNIDLGGFPDGNDLAWDSDNELMWIHNSGWRSRLVTMEGTQGFRDLDEYIYGLTFHNGFLYSTDTYSNLYKYSSDGIDLLQTIENFFAYSLTSSVENNWIIGASSGTVRAIAGDTYEEVWSFNLRQGEFAEIYPSNIVWVDNHHDGQLWMKYRENIYQLNIDLDAGTFEIVNQFQWAGERGGGFEHDGENFWLVDQVLDYVQIVDDGHYNLDEWFSVSPVDGVIEPDGTEEVTVSIDTTIPNADDYFLDLIFNSNDPENPSLAVEITIHVGTVPTIVLNRNNIDFGETFIGGTGEEILTLTNVGNSDLTVSNVTSDLEVFGSAFAQELILRRNESFDLTVTYDPINNQVDEGVLTITSDDPAQNNVNIQLSGSGIIPPEINVDPISIEANQRSEHMVAISNSGSRDIIWEAELEYVIDEQRDAAGRSVRSIENQGPRRDAAGDVISEFTWRYAATNQMKMGVNWDPDNELMWLSSYSQNRVGAIDPNNNFSEVRSWYVGSPFGIAYLNGSVYYSRYNSSTLYRYNTEGQYQGAIQLPTYVRGGITSSKDNNWIITISEHDGLLYAYTVEGDNAVEAWSMSYRHGPLVGGTIRSVEWVDYHPNGELWALSGRNVYQLNPDLDAGTHEVVQQFTRADNSSSGNIGHDNHNLWISQYYSASYQVIDDGITEIPRYLLIEPDEGVIAPGENTDMMISLDVSLLDQGDWEANVNINSNDPDDPVVAVNVMLHVTGDPAIITDLDAIDFAEVALNTSSDQILTVTNIGISDLTVSDATINGDGFTSDFGGAFTLARYETADITITFSPTARQHYDGTLVLTTNDPNFENLTIDLSGDGWLAPIISIDPMEIEDNYYSEHLLTVSNAGDFDLEWDTQITKIMEGNRDAARRSVRSIGDDGPRRDDLGDELYQYTWNNSRWIRLGLAKGYAYEGMWLTRYYGNSPGYVGNIDIEGGFVERKSFSVQQPRHLANIKGYLYIVNGFPRRYVEKYTNNGYYRSQINVVPLGNYVGAVTSSVENEWLIVDNLSTGHITAMTVENDNPQVVWDIDLASGPLADLYGYGMCWVDEHEMGELWLHYGGDVWQVDVDTEQGTYEVVYHFYWDNYGGRGIGHDGENLWLSSSTTIPYVIFDDGIDENWDWISVAPSSGTTPGGENTEVEVTLDIRELDAGDYQAEIHFLSNDPENPDVSVDAFLHVAEAPMAELAIDEIDFGNVVAYGSAQQVLRIRNIGNSDLSVSEATFEGVGFNTNQEFPVVIPRHAYYELPIVFEPIEVTDYSATITIVCDDPINGELSANLIGIGCVPQTITVDPLQVVATETGDHIVTIGNDGDYDLNWTAELIVTQEPQQDANRRNVRSTSEDIGPARDEAGDVLGQFRWYKANTYRNGYAWDEENQLMLLASYAGYVGAINPANYYSEDYYFRVSSAWGVGLLDGTTYVQTYGSRTIYKYSNTSYLGSFSLPVNPVSMTSSQENGWLIVFDNTGYLKGYTVNNNGVSQVWSVNLMQGELSGVYPYSITWVDSQPDGPLWIYNGSTIYQVSPDIQNNSFEVVSQFQWSGSNAWGGVGHDGENLWLSNYSPLDYYIVDDGVATILPWISIRQSEGTVEPNQTNELTVAISAEDYVEGIYTADLNINSNDPVNELVTVDVTLVIGENPLLTIDPAEIDYGEVIEGTSNDQTLTVSNQGNADLLISSIASTGDMYSVNFEGEIILAQGESTEYTVTFAPETPGNYEGSVTITSNDPANGEYVIALSGIGINQPGPPVAEVSPVSIESDNGGSYAFTIANTGGSEMQWTSNTVILQEAGRDRISRQVRNISNGGLHRDEGEWLSYSPVQGTIPNDDSEEISVVLDATDLDIGNYEAEIHVLSNDTANADVAVNIFMHVLRPIIEVAPGTLAFGDVDINQSGNQVLTISNIGNSDLTVSDITISGDYVTGDFAGEFVLAENETYDLSVTFAPEAVGSIRGDIVVYSDDPDNDQVSVSISGAGIGHPQINVDPVALDFGEVNLDETSTLSYLITNNGTGDLIIQNISTNSDYFTPQFNGEFIIQPGSNEQYSVTFEPAWGGGFSDVLVIQSNDVDVELELSGSGLGNLEVETQFSIDGSSNNLCIVGNVAYVAAPGGSLHIIDITDPADPVEIGVYHTPGLTADVVVSENIAYVADFDFGLRILDVSDPGNVTETGYVDTPGIAYGVALEGSIVYVADGTGGVVTVYVSDPGNPVELSTFDTPGEARQVWVEGGILFVTDGENGLVILDVSDPENPVVLGSFNSPGFSYDIVDSDGIAFLADGESGVQILDISSPDNPQWLSTIDTPGTAKGLYAIGDHLLIADGEAGFRIVDVSDPENPQDVDVFDTPGQSNAIFISGDRAYIADGENGLIGFNIGEVIPIIPEISLSDEHIEFGRIVVGTTANQNLQVSNTGDDYLVITGIVVDVDGFSCEFNDALTLSPGASENISVSFLPSDHIDYAGTLTVISNDPVNEQVVVNLNGTGLSQDISISPVEINFGEVVYQQSAELSFEITNVGNIALSISNIVVDGGDFSVDFNGGLTINAGESISKNVTYNGDTFGQVSGIITVTSDDPDSPESVINLTGTCIYPVISLSTEAIDFGGVHVSESSDMTFTITNDGTSDLTVSGVSVSGDGYTCDFAGEFVLGVGGDHIVALTLDTETYTDYPGLITIASDDPVNGEVSINLTGLGLSQDIELSTNTIAFGEIVYQQSAELTFNILNQGNYDLTVSDITVDGEDFSVDFEESFVVAAENQITKTVTYTANTFDAVSGLITVYTDDPINPEVKIDITGICTYPVVNISTEAHDFGGVHITETSDLAITISNDGTSDLTVTDISVSGDGYTTDFGGEFVLAAGNAQEIGFIFDPITYIDYPGTVTITSNDPVNGEVTIDLSGLGLSQDVELSANVLDFGEVIHPQATQLSLDIFNQGNFDLTVNDIVVEGDDFGIDFDAEFVIGAGSQVSKTVTYTANTPGVVSGTVSLYTNDPIDPVVSVDLVGICLAPEITLSPESLYLGEILIGTSSTQNFAILNEGTSDLTVSDIVSDNDAFTTNFNGEFTLSVGESRQFTVTFAPNVVQEYTNALTIISNDPDEGNTSVVLTGICFGTAEISLDRESVDFGGVLVFTNSVQTLQISNIGDIDLIVSQALVAGGGFSCDFSEEIIVDPNATQNLNITFAPEAFVNHNGTLTLSTNDPDNETVVVNLVGLGLSPDVELSTEAINFGNVVYPQSSQLTFNIGNVGNYNLTVSDMAVEGDDFAVDFGGEFVVGAGAAATMTVTYSANTFDAVSGLITITTDDPYEPVHTVELSGICIYPVIALSSEALDFGGVHVTETSTIPFQITNDGTSELTVSDVMLAGDNYSLNIFGSTVVAPGGTMQVNVTFDPDTYLGYDGLVTITSDDPVNGEVTVDLTGLGLAQDIELSTETLDFGEVVYPQSTELTFEISNVGNYDLTVTDMPVQGDDFVVNLDGTFVIAAGATVTMTATYAANTFDTVEGMIAVITDDPYDPVMTVHLTGVCIYPVITLSDDVLDFGEVHVTETSDIAFVITNDGTSDLTVSDVLVEGESYYGDFGDEFVLGVGESQDVVLTFDPTTYIEYLGLVSITSDDPVNGVVFVDLSGLGLSQDIELSTESIDFGDVVYGNSVDITFDIFNVGNYDMTVNDMIVDGDDFNVDFGGEFVIPAGGYETMTATYTAYNFDDVTGLITITTDDPYDPVVDIELSGTCLYPVITLSTEYYDFGGVLVGENGTFMLEVGNEGTSDLHVSDFILEDLYYSSDTDYEFVVTPGEFEMIEVAFVPGTYGQFDGQIDIFCDDPVNPEMMVELTAIGLASDITIDVESLNFGDVQYTQEMTLSVTIGNIGNIDLIVSEALNSEADFLVHFDEPIIVAPGASTELDVTFEPTEYREYTDELTVVSNDPDESEVVIGLSGRGVWIQASLFAQRKIIVKKDAVIGSGDVWVNTEYEDGPELLVHQDVAIAGDLDVKASRISIHEGAVIDANVTFNDLQNQGTINGTEASPLTPLPLIDAAHMPEFPEEFVYNDDNVRVGRGEDGVLEPGTYGDIDVDRDGILVLTGGVYNFADLRIDRSANLVFSDVSQIFVAGQLHTQQQAYVGPADGVEITAADIIFYVGEIPVDQPPENGDGEDNGDNDGEDNGNEDDGEDGGNGRGNGNGGGRGGPGRDDGEDEEDDAGNLVKIGMGSTWHANVYTAIGSIKIDKEVIAEGSFIGMDITIDMDTEITFNGGFSGNEGIVIDAAPGEVLLLIDNPLIPKEAILGSYPNPFNAVATVNYGLPEAAHISIMVYDVSGRQVAELVNGYKPAGYHITTWNANTLSNGLYLVRYSGSSKVIVRKMLLTK